MAQPKFGVYIWATWITGLLSGEDHCAWAANFKARFQYDKVADEGFDSVAYNAAHKELVNRRVKELRDDGWAVTKEHQNAFKLRGKTAILAGKPDIIAIKDDVVLVSDPKTGARRNAHWWQVAIYLLALTRVRKDLAGMTFVGELVYGDSEPQRITMSDVTPEVAARVWAQVQEASFNIPPEKVPSEAECGFCNVPQSECPERMAVTVAMGETKEF